MNKSIMLILVALFLIVSAAYAGDLEEVTNAGVLQFGVSPDRAPFVFYDENEDLTGIDIKIMEEIAARMNLKLEVSEMSSDDLIESLAIGQADVIGGAFSKTDARQEIIDFSNIYYAADGLMMARDTLQLPEPLNDRSFLGKKIGVIKNSGFEVWLKNDMSNKGNVLKKDIYTFDQMSDEVRALDKGRIELAVMDFSLYQAMYQNDPDYHFYEYGDARDKYAFGLRKGSDLKTEINKHLSVILKDGTAQTIADTFFNMDYSSPSVIHLPDKKPDATATPTPTPALLPTVQAAVPTAAPVQQNCTYSVAYVMDVTIPDGQPVSAGSTFTKTWRLKNTGSCPWNQDFYLAFVSGSQMGGANQYMPTAVYPGENVDISVNLTAPDGAGTYQGYWQMKTPQGTGFGITIWVQIVVPGAYTPPTAVYEMFVPTYHYMEMAPTATPHIMEYKPIIESYATPTLHILDYKPIHVYLTATPFQHVLPGLVLTSNPTIPDSIVVELGKKKYK